LDEQVTALPSLLLLLFEALIIKERQDQEHEHDNPPSTSPSTSIERSHSQQYIMHHDLNHDDAAGPLFIGLSHKNHRATSSSITIIVNSQRTTPPTEK
jgi:hypothetical protein